MFSRLFVLFFCVASSTGWAQRALNAPDLSALTFGRSATLTVDAKDGWIYASGDYGRAMGVRRNGLARVNAAGVIDFAWKLEGLSQAFSHVSDPDGNLYVHGLDSVTGAKVVARYKANGGPQPSHIYRISVIAGNGNSGIWYVYSATRRWLYFSVDGLLRRIDTSTGELDAMWSFVITQSLRAVSVSADIDGPLYVLEQQYPGLERDMYVRRIDTGSVATVLWTKTFAVTDAQIALDSSGGVYVLTRDGKNLIPTKPAAVHRLLPSGEIDTAWNGAAASQAMSQSLANSQLKAHGDGLIVPAYVDATTPGAGVAGVVRFDRRGVEVARWSPGITGQIDAIVDGHNSELYVSVKNTLHALDAVTLQTKRAVTLSFGEIGYVTSITALPDGGRLFTGQFDVWYGGARFQNVLRTRADGMPDTTWRIETDGAVHQIRITAQGVIVAGEFTRINGVTRTNAALVSLSSGAAVKDWIAPASLYVWYSSINFDADNDETLYYTQYFGDAVVLRRVSLRTGAVDPDWTLPVDTGFVGAITGVNVDNVGGIWLFRDFLDGFGSTEVALIRRFSIRDKTLTASIQTNQSQRQTRYAAFTNSHAYIGDARYSLLDGGQRDVRWQPLGPSGIERTPYALAGGYLYYYDGSVRRAALSGNGAADSTWVAQPRDMVTCTGGAFALFVQSPLAPMNDAEFLIKCYDRAPMPPILPASEGGLVLATSRNDATSDKTVIEYFSRVANRYFMTGRVNEQAQLDAMPASFTRTGMRFSAKSGLYRDIAETAVCRFYAAPESGGSNTHFYGTGEVCPALNTVKGLSFEGFDFAALAPSSAGSCDNAAANKPVWRLYNDKFATNESNHRYVVSETTRSKMRNQGWIDEGVAFCVSSVTDATN